MLTIKTSKQIPNMTILKTFRSTRLLDGPGYIGIDAARISAGEGRLHANQARRKWLGKVWHTRKAFRATR